MKRKLKKNVFIGPLPPPLGGVAIINQSFQSLNYDGYINLVFDTSNKSNREDLYKGLPWQNIFNEHIKVKKLKDFIKKNQPDVANVFMTSGYSIIRDFFYLRLLNANKIPVVVHFHSKKKGEFALSPRRIKLVGRLLKKYADKIILLSKDHYNYFSKYFDERQCEIIENFVDYNSFNNTIENKTDDFLYVGRLSKEKGFFDLLKASAELNNKGESFKINIVGIAPNDQVQNEIDNFVKHNNLQGVLCFHGLKFGEEKLELFKKSKILISPSHFENSPVVLKEGIAAKMAIVASDIEANKNILEGKNNYNYHEVKNPEDIARTIDNIIKNPATTLEYCKASEKIKEYDSEIARKKLERILNKICL
ncbi:glycosyltransferase family 4 protein [Winogradskyella poriferorum]|uniref:glycosyltransferase family 4 protein n=1 Tax=Winogradskyella poriferorum TaxID=307627 RepID=UPI003D662907